MTTRIFISLLLFCKVGFTQTLNADAIRVKSAYEIFLTDTSSKKLQKIYIDSFPSDANSFLAIFQSTEFDQLYMDSYKYIEAFEKCGTTFPEEVISKCVDIGKNLAWDADAIGHLQLISVDLALTHLNVFITKYKTLNKKDQSKLITFFADVENHKTFQQYQKLINKLESVGEIDIALKLDSARAIRIKSFEH
jgi:hypothetical protein